ncbi:MAG: Uma2 family endonuclease [Gemmataceae bacterium]
MISTPKPAADPFAIGWRNVRHTHADGTTVVEQVPLTLQDALHPREEDEIVNSTLHSLVLTYLCIVARSRIANIPGGLVLCDTKVLWADGKHHSPDLAVFLGVTDPDRPRGQFDVAAEGELPSLIVEVVSPSTRENDVTTKVEHYHRYKVPLYVIVDREDEESAPRLIGYRWTPRRYVRMEPDDGRLWLEPLGIYLGIVDGRVVAYDGETDEELIDYPELKVALVEERTRADEEKARADEEKARADAEQARAAQQKARADAEKVRAETEKARADAAEERLRVLEEELRIRPPAAGS